MILSDATLTLSSAPPAMVPPAVTIQKLKAHEQTRRRAGAIVDAKTARKKTPPTKSSDKPLVVVGPADVARRFRKGRASIRQYRKGTTSFQTWSGKKTDKVPTQLTALFSVSLPASSNSIALLLGCVIAVVAAVALSKRG